MAYIGKDPIVGNFQVCDAISVVNGQAAYTMQVSSTNVVPESANHMLVSLNGILQKPNSSFTVSGSTITFASALATGDVIDFIMLLGNVLDLGVPSDATVTDAKANFVSTSSAAGLQIKGDGTTDGTLQLNCSQNSHGIKLKSPAHSAGQSYTLTFPATAPSSGKALVTDGSGNLSFSSAGGLNLISTTTISSVASVDVTGMDSTYKNYVMMLNNIHPADNNVQLRARAIISGSAYTSSNYFSIIEHSRTGNASVEFDNNEGLNIWTLTHDAETMGNADSDSMNMIINIYNPSDTTFEKHIQTQATYNHKITNNMTSRSYGMNAIHSITSAYTGMQFFFSSGNIDSGSIKLYGIS